MGGVAREKKVSKPHRLRDKTAKWRDALFDRRSDLEVAERLSIESSREFIPELIVRPIFDMLVHPALKIVPAAGLGPHRAEGKATFVVDIDEFVGCWRLVDKDTEPSEGVDALEGPKLVLWDGPAAHAMKTVAAGNVVAQDLLIGAIPTKSDQRLFASMSCRLTSLAS